MKDEDRRLLEELVPDVSEVKIIDPNDIEQMQLVCILASDETEFTDNVQGNCSGCGARVQHRPHNFKPETVKLMCLRCMSDGVQEQLAQDEEVTFAVSPKTYAEVMLHIKRKHTQ